MPTAFKHIALKTLIIDKVCYDRLSYENRSFFKFTNDKPTYKFFSEKNGRMSFIPIQT